MPVILDTVAAKASLDASMDKFADATPDDKLPRRNGWPTIQQPLPGPRTSASDTEVVPVEEIKDPFTESGGKDEVISVKEMVQLRCPSDCFSSVMDVAPYPKSKKACCRSSTVALVGTAIELLPLVDVNVIQPLRAFRFPFTVRVTAYDALESSEHNGATAENTGNGGPKQDSASKT